MIRTLVPAKRLVPGDRVMGLPGSPLYIAARPKPKNRYGIRVGWSVEVLSVGTMDIYGDPVLDVLATNLSTDGEPR